MAQNLSTPQVRLTVGLTIVGAAIISPPAVLGWTSVGPGIEYQEFYLPTPNRVYVARMDRLSTECFVDSTLAGSRLSVNETIGSQAARYHDAINYVDQDWGQRNNVIVAINGDFPDTSDNIRQPKRHSTTFSWGDVVSTSSPNVRVRPGPGTNYLVRTTVGNNVQGTVLDHHLRGIHAKGDYWWKCDFSGTQGWVSESLLALVSTGDLPRFTQRPEPAYACAGDSAAFSVAASGAGTLSYRWQFNGVELQEGGAYIGTATPMLTIAHPTVAEVGSYRCVVTGANGSVVSWSAPLRMMTATQILLQPQSTDPPLPRGADAAFSTLARGEGMLTYRWQKDGQDISDSVKYTGTTTPALTVWDALTEDEGEYRRVVTGACGTVETDPAVLTVLSPDFDRDGDVDQSDFGFLQACFSGSTIPQPDPARRAANLDADPVQDADQSDLAIFLECWSGPDQPRPPGC